MSQMDFLFQALLARHPEIEKSYREGLINRRALARFLIDHGVGDRSAFDAVVATIRRHDFGPKDGAALDLFHDVRVSLKDRILILDFEKDKELLRRLERLFERIDYDRGDTLKIVVGTASIKVVVDQSKEAGLRDLIGRSRVRERLDHISEISLRFPADAARTKNVLGVITRELALHDVVVAELLTASPELLIYVRDEFVTRAYEVVRALQALEPLTGPRPRR